MLIKLTSGETVSLDSLHFGHTYAGLLEGLPTPDMNAEILANAPSRMVTLWGPRTTHVIPPTTRHERGRVIFPDLIFFAWLTSNTPINPEFMASELVVVWFAPEQPDVPLSTIVTEAVRDIPWASLAKDIYW
jgi:hypothetical protein